jgi:hypothetical protein
MTVNCDYASPDNQLTVNYHFDADSMTIYPVDHPSVVAFLANGGTIGPYTPPAPPLTNGQIDQATMNAALAASGSVFRGLALVVLDLANGVIPIKPATPYTQTQLANLIVAKMR